MSFLPFSSSTIKFFPGFGSFVKFHSKIIWDSGSRIINDPFSLRIIHMRGSSWLFAHDTFRVPQPTCCLIQRAGRIVRSVAWEPCSAWWQDSSTKEPSFIVTTFTAFRFWVFPRFRWQVFFWHHWSAPWLTWFFLTIPLKVAWWWCLCFLLFFSFLTVPWSVLLFYILVFTSPTRT